MMSGKVYKIGYRNVKNVDRETGRERGGGGNSSKKWTIFGCHLFHNSFHSKRVISFGKYFLLFRQFHFRTIWILALYDDRQFMFGHLAVRVLRTHTGHSLKLTDTFTFIY